MRAGVATVHGLKGFACASAIVRTGTGVLTRCSLCLLWIAALHMGCVDASRRLPDGWAVERAPRDPLHLAIRLIQNARPHRMDVRFQPDPDRIVTASTSDPELLEDVQASFLGLRLVRDDRQPSAEEGRLELHAGSTRVLIGLTDVGFTMRGSLQGWICLFHSPRLANIVDAVCRAQTGHAFRPRLRMGLSAPRAFAEDVDADVAFGHAAQLLAQENLQRVSACVWHKKGLEEVSLTTDDPDMLKRVLEGLRNSVRHGFGGVGMIPANATYGALTVESPNGAIEIELAVDGFVLGASSWPDHLFHSPQLARVVDDLHFAETGAHLTEERLLGLSLPDCFREFCCARRKGRQEPLPR